MPGRMTGFRLAAIIAMAMLPFSAWGGVFAQASNPSAAPGGPRGASEPGPSLERRILACFDRGDYAAAAALIEEHLKTSPSDPEMLYNLACARCRLKDNDAAAAALLRAFKAGFRDIQHMRSDPDLRPLRDDPVYRRILEEADRRAAEMSRDAVTRWRDAHPGDDYRYETDDEHHLQFATALDDDSREAMKRMLLQEADQIIKTLVDLPPSYFVLIAIPTPGDADKYFKGNDAIGGIYEHGPRQLVSRDIGGSLRHEFFHLMHYGHMERLGQPHPLWIQEGLACLYEDYEVSADGGFRFTPNDRQLVAKARAKSGMLVKWKALFAMSAADFMDKAQQMYPQARSIFEFVADKGLLPAWYKAYVAHFEEDRTGTKAFEIAFGKPVDEVERDWRKWLIEQPAIDLQINDGDAALGVRSRENLSNDGVLVTDVIPNSAAFRGRIRKGDVIVSIDGRSTRSLLDLRRIIAARKVGDEVEVKARRAGEYYTVKVTLRPVVAGTG